MTKNVTFKMDPRKDGNRFPLYAEGMAHTAYS